MKLLKRLNKWWKKQWEVIPTKPSDVVSLTIVRKDSTGRFIKFTLDGEDAFQWGWLMANCVKLRDARSKEGEGKTWKELNWRKEYITLT